MMQAKKGFFLPEDVVQRDGPFREFKQDAAFVSVELKDGRLFHHVLILYPGQIIAMKGQDTLPFEPNQVKRVFQTEDDLKMRSDSRWTFWL
jgi:hypothetical protein